MPETPETDRPLFVPPADHQLKVTLLGPQQQPEEEGGRYPPRPELATLDVPVDAERGWTIFLGASRGAVAGTPVLLLSDEEATRLREEFTREHRGT